MSKYENSHREQIELKYALKFKFEELRHKNKMEEITLEIKLLGKLKVRK